MKPIKKITIETIEGNRKKVEALIDSGSFYTIIHHDVLPHTKYIYYYDKPKKFGTASKEGSLIILGETKLIMELNKKRFDDSVLISEHLSRDIIIGAKTMQAWDITIQNKKGQMKIKVGRDMRDPDITEVI